MSTFTTYFSDFKRLNRSLFVNAGMHFIWSARL